MNSYVAGDSETFGREDGGVGDPRRSRDGGVGDPRRTVWVQNDGVDESGKSKSVSRFRATIWN